LVLHGEKGVNGMIMDFIELKKVMRKIVDDFDHRVLLPGNCPRVVLSVGDEIVAKVGKKRYVFPAEDVVILDIEEASAEEVARVMLARILEEVRFPGNVTKVEVGLEEERGQSAWASHDLR
jgi:6-pyruvoyltetrahydropterin/6-carboxytetrahydropterin synthase